MADKTITLSYDGDTLSTTTVPDTPDNLWKTVKLEYDGTPFYSIKLPPDNVSHTLHLQNDSSEISSVTIPAQGYQSVADAQQAQYNNGLAYSVWQQNYVNGQVAIANQQAQINAQTIQLLTMGFSAEQAAAGVTELQATLDQANATLEQSAVEAQGLLYNWAAASRSLFYAVTLLAQQNDASQAQFAGQQANVATEAQTNATQATAMQQSGLASADQQMMTIEQAANTALLAYQQTLNSQATNATINQFEAQIQYWDAYMEGLYTAVYGISQTNDNTAAITQTLQ